MPSKHFSLGDKRVLITGGSGMLASDLLPRLRRTGADVQVTVHRTSPNRTAPNSGTKNGGAPDGAHLLDVTEALAVRDLVERTRPQFIVNCAAYTKVDDAESARGPAFEVNAMGPAHLAEAAAEVGAFVVHVSTDYVFGAGESTRREPYKEDEPLRPTGIYGHSKRFGEELLKRVLPDAHLILRTSWLHGRHGPNFVQTMLRVGAERESVRVVDDQVGSPTWTGWLAGVIVGAMEQNAHGVYHASSRGGVSWFDFAREIFRLAGMRTEVEPQSTADLNRPAERPAFSVLDVSKLESLLGEQCVDWRDGLRSHLTEIGRLQA